MYVYLIYLFISSLFKFDYTSSTYIYTSKIAVLLKIVSMLINVNWKIIKNNQIKNSYCLMKINVNLSHHTSPRHLKRSHEGLYGLHKTLSRHHKEVRKQRFTSTNTCCPRSGQAGLIIQNKLLKKQRKTVIILKRVNIKFRYNLDFCLCVKVWNQHVVCKFCKVCKDS